jgi:hypothetical protein
MKDNLLVVLLLPAGLACQWEEGELEGSVEVEYRVSSA